MSSPFRPATRASPSPSASGVRNRSPNPGPANRGDQWLPRPAPLPSALSPSSSSSSPPREGRTPCGRSAGVGDGAQGDAAVDLDATGFNAFLGAAREPFAVVEFYANWCPACRNYKPHYEKVAKLFNGPDAALPRRVLMVRVDCAIKVNIDLCNRFSVDHYPFLLWGPPTKFVKAKWDWRQDKNEIKLIYDGRTAERLLKWINKQMESSFTLDDKKTENEIMLLKIPETLNRLFEHLSMLRNSAI